ncbi:putative quinol monooxygenase [Streptomyces lonarensis]|uniref:Antibiotic biosynthesis monooxygenase n=2 Tax=Streptomyces lonarensis TaxID=700599 RepID=A0A7X6D352_9ACTN|nr:putative quinol monooxygenase [Streptomyces lonarensis]NJQ07133.1 antibiotic biosynthesis monooxygenase [Streptomyces lonarensis]
MIAQIVTLQVRPGELDGFTAAIAENAAASVATEDGCLQFDVVATAADDHSFVLYERYTDEAALAAHRATDHFARWTRAVGRYVVDGSKVNTVGTVTVHRG